MFIYSYITSLDDIPPPLCHSCSDRLGILIVSNMALYHHLMSYQSPATTANTRPDPLTKQSVGQP